MHNNSLEQDRNDQLVLDSKQASWVVSGLLLLVFFVFMAGYFLGKHQALEQFSHALDQESIADKIYSSLYSSYDGKIGSDSGESDNIKAEDADNAPGSEISPDQSTQVAAVETITVPAERSIPEQATSAARYYAQLIGFGSSKVAQKYVDKLTKQGFPVTIKQRTSKTSQGRTASWYQVVTLPCASREELTAMIDRLTHQEKLKGVRILKA